MSRAPFSFHRARLADFHDLMRHRIMDILLVASPYDSFLLEEAGELSERVRGEFRNLDLHYGPGLTSVATGAEALAAARQSGRYGLIISALQLSDLSVAELALRARAEAWECPWCCCPTTTASCASSRPARTCRRSSACSSWLFLKP